MNIADAKTTTEVARELGLASITIQRWCQALDYQKIGRDYLLTGNQIEQLKAVSHNKIGRPGKTLIRINETQLRHLVHCVLEAKEKRNEIAIIGGSGWANTFAVKIDPEMTEKAFSEKLEAFAEK